MSNIEKSKRVVYVRWKEKDEIEIFSNLKILCISYPRFNYNTVNNYLSKQKKPFVNALVHIERKTVITKPIMITQSHTKVRNIASAVRKIPITQAGDDINDLLYWLDQPVQKRAQAVTFLVSQMLNGQQRLDKTIVNKFKSDK